MEENGFDSSLARAYCMNYGALVGALCSASFLCSMYGMQSPLLGMLSNLLGVGIIIAAGNSIRSHRRNVQEVTFGRACWMSILIFFYAILLTALVQYFYFAVLDHGRLAEQIHQMVSIPEYRALLESLAGGTDAEAQIKMVTTVMSSPAQATLQLLWMNCMMALLATLPVAFIGRMKI